MSEINALRAQINALGQARIARNDSRSTKSNNRPRASWKSKERVQYCIDKKLCIRCERKGHIGPDCPDFKAPQRPKEISAVQTTKPESESESDISEKE